MGKDCYGSEEMMMMMTEEPSSGVGMQPFMALAECQSPATISHIAYRQISLLSAIPAAISTDES